MRKLLAVAVLCSIGVVGCGGGGDDSAPRIKQITTESMTKTGDLWTVKFTSDIAASD